MQEILFRGKRLVDCNWVEGYYIKTSDMFGDETYAIIFRVDVVADLDIDKFDGYRVVRPETVGQFTGLVDKDGKKIFEGDIIKLDNSLDTKQKNFEVKIAYGQFYIGINKPVAYVRDRCEVIGNIYDNPELLEAK